MSRADSVAHDFLSLEEAVIADLDAVSDQEGLARYHRGIIERTRGHVPERIGRLTASLDQDVTPAPTGQLEQDALKVIDLPHFQPIEGRPSETFAALQEWEGLVTGIGEGVIFADLIDLTSKQEIVGETAEIPLEEISDDDRDRAVAGAIFRWAVGYVRKPSGQKMRGSLIYFRRGSVAQKSGSEEIPRLRFEEGDD